MKELLKVGDVIPEFTYDTPYVPQSSFYALCAEKPVWMLFLPNFGHPVTRWLAGAYVESYPALSNSRLLLVVRSKPQTIAAALPEGSLPYSIICDAESVLYDYFCVPKLPAVRTITAQEEALLAQAEKMGYVRPEAEDLYAPLALLVGGSGKVLSVRVGEHLLDLPLNCHEMKATVTGLMMEASIETGEGMASSSEAAVYENGEDPFAGSGKLSAVENQNLEPEQQKRILHAMDLLYGTAEAE